MSTRLRLFLAAALFGLLASCHSTPSPVAGPGAAPGPELIYHVFLRSFYDSNGDQNGDLRGLDEQLPYLQQLGVTAIQLTPLYPSAFYHNYFADAFHGIDSSYGSLQDWVHLVEDLHRRGMKVYMDMEIQYVTARQRWFRDSYRRPGSPYSSFLIYHGPGNTKPEPGFLGIDTLIGYNGVRRRVASVNLLNPQVQAYFRQLFRFWMDPNGDGRFDDGVDGFRIDHMMDDLDGKHLLTGLFRRFWAPLLDSLRALNPRVQVVAEQADWANMGGDYFRVAGVNRIFDFRLERAIRSFDKDSIARSAAASFAAAAPDHQQVVFIENHDLERFSTFVGADSGKLRIGAALNLLIGGIPAIYYGQEIGMQGLGGFGRFGKTDGNDIPQREAFEWYRADTGRGMCLWYRNSGPWWDSTSLHPDDGISLQEEQADSSSLYWFYRRLIRLRQSHAPFIYGAYRTLSNDNPSVLSFERQEASDSGLVVVNLSAQPQTLHLYPAGARGPGGTWKLLLGNARAADSTAQWTLSLAPYGISVWVSR